MQIASGLDHMHENDVVHCDLKEENILLHKHPEGSIRAKICDFGLGRVVITGACATAETERLYAS